MQLLDQARVQPIAGHPHRKGPAVALGAIHRRAPLRAPLRGAILQIIGAMLVRPKAKRQGASFAAPNLCDAAAGNLEAGI
jgi:hypothetical protein